MDDVVRAAVDRSRWLEDLFAQAAAQFAIHEQVMAPLRELILRYMNAAGPGRTVHFPQDDGGLSAEQRHQAAAALQARTALLEQIRDRLRSGRDEERRAAAIYLLASGQWWWNPGWTFTTAAASAEGWTAPELRAALGLLLAADWLSYEDVEQVGAWVTAIERLDDAERGDLVPLLHAAAVKVSESPPGMRCRGRVIGQITRLLRELDPGRIPDGLLVPADNWAPPLIRLLAEGGHHEVAELAVHLSALRGPRPARKWRSETLRLLRTGPAREFVRAGLRGLARCEPATVAASSFGGEYRAVVCEQNSLLARGVVWAAALLAEEGTVAGLAGEGTVAGLAGEGTVAGLAGEGTAAGLAEVALRTGESRRDIAQEFKIAGAAINALGESTDPAALETLWMLQSRIRLRSLRKQLDVAIGVAAQRHGITPAELVERSVPGHGLGPGGTLSRDLGPYTALITIGGPRTVRLAFRAPDGRTAKGVPGPVAGGFPVETAELKALVKDVRSTLAAENRRLESLFATERTWPLVAWKRHYLDHPVTGAIARHLIWEVDAGNGQWTGALPGPDGFTAAGRRLAAHPDDARVRLWHPARAGLAEVRRWRATIADRQPRQPCKQAFREVYRITPAEELAETHSERFAGHILDYPRLYALLVQRGWRSNYLGPFDGGDEGDATAELMAGEWRVRFRYQAIDPGTDAQVALATTGQVGFERRDGRAWRQAALRDVPSLVFSEALRDVDLFVSVTSIGSDPDWPQRDEDAYRAYWSSFASGELTPSAQVRRAALERLVPKLKIAERCRLTDRYLVVRGRHRTYKIHIGSASVLMEPGSTYLCIVARRAAGEKVFLPFEEDGRLAVILSKAFLLAADDAITDETIRQQIEAT